MSQNRPQFDSNRVQDQLGFLMNQNYLNTGGRFGAKQRSDERVTTGNTGQNFLNKFIYGKEGERKGKLNPFGINLPDFGVTEAISGAGSKIADVLSSPQTDPNQTQLGDSFNRDQYNKDLRDMLITNSLLRRGELAAERRENLNFMKSMYPLLEQAGRSQLERAIEGDQRSPTKISQQILRAKTGEAALMQAIANQASAGAQIGGLGTGRRFGRG